MDTKSIKYYDQNASRLAPEYHSAEVTGIHTLLGRWLPTGGEVLEIGCGAGRNAAFMANLGCKVTATDASEKILEYSLEYLTKIGEVESIGLIQADFPLKANHNLLNHRFDAVVSMAVLMHIPDNELFDFAFQIRTILKYKGHFICSFCTSRETLADDPRLFVNRDRKVATYKLALLRALCEISQTEYRNAQWHSNNRVSVPVGFDVDHIIPFSLLHNNDLWNLVPSDQKVNNIKRDKIISRETLRQCEDRIVYFWQIQNKTNPEHFKNEVGWTLLGCKIQPNSWKRPALKALAEAVELVAIQRGVERLEMTEKPIS